MDFRRFSETVQPVHLSVADAAVSEQVAYEDDRAGRLAVARYGAAPCAGSPAGTRSVTVGWIESMIGNPLRLPFMPFECLLRIGAETAPLRRWLLRRHDASPHRRGPRPDPV